MYRATFALIVAEVTFGSLAYAQKLPQQMPVSAFAVSDTVIDLETAIRRAVQASPTVALGNASLTTATSAKRVADAAYVPTLSATATSLRSDIVSATPGSAPNGTSLSTGLSSSVDLFTAGRRSADRARAGADLVAAQASDVAQRYSVILLDTRTFFEALRGTDLVSVALARVARGERGLRFALDRVKAGTATKSDELRAKLELTSGRQQLLAARDTQQTATLNLGRLVGADGPVGAKQPASLEPRPLSLDDSAIVRLAIESAPSVTAATASARATSAATRAARTLYAPDIRLTGGYALANQSPILSATRPGWQLAIGTTFPLFNGFQREDAIARSETTAEVARVTALDVTRAVRTESIRLLTALRLASENIDLAKEAQAAAAEDLRVQSERYRAGITTSLDQLTSELALTQAELGLVAARFNYQIVRASLEALVGRPL